MRPADFRHSGVELHPAPLVYPTYQLCALCFEVIGGKAQEGEATYVFVKRAELALSGARFSAWLSPTGCLRARTVLSL